VRICTYPVGPSLGVVYIVPSDDLSQCIVVQTAGSSLRSAQLNATPCDELGWSRDPERTLADGRPVTTVVATAEGSLAIDGADRYDILVTLAGGDGVRVVRAVGNTGVLGDDTDCYRLGTTL